MSGPIVRSGPSPEFTKNWDSVFGKKTGKSPAKTAKAPVKSTKKKAAAKPVKKALKKKK